MGLYGVSMALNGSLWVSMGRYGVSMGSLWLSVGRYGSLWGPNGEWEPLLAELGTPKCRGNGGGSLWGLYGVSVGRSGVSMVSLWGLYRVL